MAEANDIEANVDEKVELPSVHVAEHEAEQAPLSSGSSGIGVTTSSKSFWQKNANKGNISNVATFVVMCLGIVLHISFRTFVPWKYLLSFGLFGFAGGFTNWLAVKMLFDRIPGLAGSGVIPRQFKAIRMTVKNTIMKTFFDAEYLDNYLSTHAKSFLGKIDLGAKIRAVLDNPETDALIVTKLQEASAKPEGAMLGMAAGFVPGGIPGMVPMLKPMLLGFADEMAQKLVDSFNPSEVINIDQIRQQIDDLMTEKLQQLTPEIVKKVSGASLWCRVSSPILWYDTVIPFVTPHPHSHTPF